MIRRNINKKILKVMPNWLLIGTKYDKKLDHKIHKKK